MTSNLMPTGEFKPVACCAMTRGGVCHLIRPIDEQAEVQSFCEQMGQHFLVLSCDSVTNTKMSLSQYQKGLPVHLLGVIPAEATTDMAPAYCDDVSEALLWVHGWNAARKAILQSASAVPQLPDPLNDERIGATTNTAFAKGWNALRDVLRDAAVVLSAESNNASDHPDVTAVGPRGFNTGDTDLDALLDTVYAIASGPSNMDVALMMMDQIDTVRARLTPAATPDKDQE